MYDVIVIGAGPGGTALGALLAREGMRTLVLEGGPAVGGRSRTLAGGDYADLGSMEREFTGAGVRILSEPQPLDTALREGKLRDYHFEYGEHGIAGSHLLRIGHVAQLAGAEVEVAPNVGAWWDHEGTLYEIRKGEPFEWMDAADHEGVRAISRAAMRLADEEVDELDDTPFSEWMRHHTDSAVALSFHGVMATLNTGPADPVDISTGEHLRINRQIIKAGAHITWAGIGFPVPGYGAIPEAFNEAFLAAGGELRTNTPVREIIVEHGAVRGVRTDEGRIDAKLVVSSVPVPYMDRLLPANDALRTDQERYAGFRSGAALTFYLGLREPLVDDAAWYSTPLVAPESDGYSGDLVGGWIASSNCVASRAPDGRQLLESWCGLTTEEALDERLVANTVRRQREFLQHHYPELERTTEWELVTLAPRAYPVLPLPGQVRLSLTDCEPGWYDGLYLVGDTVRSWGCSIDRVMHAVLLCAERITGKPFLDVLPESMR